MQSSVRPTVIEELRARIQGIERPAAAVVETRTVSTGFPALNKLLAHGGLKRGTLVEWLNEEEGSGAASLALAVAGRMVRRDGLLIVIDPAGDFYPPGAALLGVPLERTVVIHPDNPFDKRMDVLWAWEQSLRCPGVTVTLGWLGAVNERLFRRLQLGVETGGGLGFLLRPPDFSCSTSWGSTYISVRPMSGKKKVFSYARPTQAVAERERDDAPWGRWLQVGVPRGQTEAPENFIEVALLHETDHVRLVPQLDDSAPPGHSAVG